MPIGPRNPALEPGFNGQDHGDAAMKRILSLLIVTLTTVPVQAADGMRASKDIPYSGAGDNRTRLDVYAPGEGKGHPVVIWIHGGAWQVGAKANVQAKPKAFSGRGYVLASINSRFHPAVPYKEQAGDIAEAIRWVHDHAGDHGGDPS